MATTNDYTPPLALTVLSGIFLAIGALCFLVVLGDIVWRRGWRSMMAVMIPVYTINATYMLLFTLWLYFQHGRPADPNDTKAHSGGHDSHDDHGQKHGGETDPSEAACHDASPPPPQHHRTDQPSPSDAEKGEQPACHSHAAPRPMYVTVFAGVSHCGAGCVLGDLVGEWLVYGSGARLGGEKLWAELLIDYAFALLFGVAFQYFSIAPMSGQYGPGTVWRALKADILSLTSFEIGLFGWMIIYQVAIFDYRLGIATWTYWWMMQIGMVLGFATAVPVNWWLISKGIKEPCA